MRQERTTRLARRLLVLDSKGALHTVEEWGDFVRVQYADDSWSEWGRAGGRLKMGRQHINPTDNEGVFEVAMTGEKLTVISPGQEHQSQ